MNAQVETHIYPEWNIASPLNLRNLVAIPSNPLNSLLEYHVT